MKGLPLFVLTLGLVLFLTHPEAHADDAAKARQYYQWNEVCQEGDLDQIDKTIGLLVKALQQEPNDHLARAYLGSAYALRAKFGKWPPTRLSNLNKAKELMNQAVRHAPHDARVRTVRAIAGYKVPKRFGYREVAIGDFKTVVPLALKGGQGLTIRERQAILYYASQAYREEEVKGWKTLRQACHRLDPDNEYGQATK
ncbi:MAG: hypothetical protein Q7Q71_14605 [Verrucomicrobiota bacterium JB023]|nr:hypothetical protein [Verrucomicrobiota bacterium JB023]